MCVFNRPMTGELTSRSGVESRPPRLSQHHQLLHPTKTDEIEILESGGVDDHLETKVSDVSCLYTS